MFHVLGLWYDILKQFCHETSFQIMLTLVFNHPALVLPQLWSNCPFSVVCLFLFVVVVLYVLFSVLVC